MILGSFTSSDERQGARGPRSRRTQLPCFRQPRRGATSDR